MTKAELAMYDVYGDGEVLRVFENTPAARRAFVDWCEHDAQYIAGEIGEDEYQTVDAFLESKGVKVFTTTRVYAGRASSREPRYRGAV